MMTRVTTPVLEIACDVYGEAGGWPVVLLHGWPYDVRAFDEVVPLLAARGARVVVPYLRGYGPTRFISQTTMRSGQQGALGADLIDLLDALDLRAALLAGFDWGSRAACVAAALWPERVTGLVSVNGYTIQAIARAGEPLSAENEHRLWYQYLLHGERGRRQLVEHRDAFLSYLWRRWSPTWAFDGETFGRTAASFANPDFVDVTLHSYRHRFGLVPGDPAYDAIEARLARQPPITVPAITLDGEVDGVIALGGTAGHAAHFTGRYEHVALENVGHDLPQEAPGPFADAILKIRAWAA